MTTFELLQKLEENKLCYYCHTPKYCLRDSDGYRICVDCSIDNHEEYESQYIPLQDDV